MESVYFTDLPKRVQKNVDSLLKERTFSFSRLSIIESCMFLYFLKYVEQLSENGEVLPLVLGKAVHKAIEGKLKGLDDKQALLSGWKEVDYYPFELSEYELLYRRADVQRGEALSDLIKTEFYFKLPLENSSDSPVIQGYIDYLRQVFGRYDFNDWKTNRIMYEPTDTNQLPLYAWAISKIYNVDSVTGTLSFLRFYRNRKKSRVFHHQDMEQARKWALNLARKALNSLENLQKGKSSVSKAFPPTLNEHCGNCPFAHVCVSAYENIENQKRGA